MSFERRLIVDRIEGDTIVLESDTSVVFDVPRGAFPEVQEGDILILTKQDSTQSDAADRLERLKNRSPQPSGNIIDL
jgi:hypothetical protein